MHILLIEDDVFVAEFEKRVLKDHEVTHAVSLHDAFTVKLNIDLGAGNPIDLIVLDLRLPRKVEYKGQKYYDPKEVIKAVDERFAGIPIVIVSAFLDEETIKFAIERKCFCIDKTLLAESQAFMNLLMAGTEVSTNMRSLAHHLTYDAVNTACAESAPATVTERVNARLYLFAGTTVISLPWLLIGYTIYSRTILHDNAAMPLYTEMLFFCGLGIAAILGILPWFVKYFESKFR